MTITIRLVKPEADFPRIAELFSLEAAEPVPVEELFEEEERMLPGDVRHHIVAMDRDNKIVGYSLAARTREESTGYFHLAVLVDPQYRRRGVGSTLYEHLDQFVRDRGATKLFGKIREKNAAYLPFARQRGFSIRNQMFVSRIDLSSFDETRFTGLIETVEATGIHFSTLEAEGNTPQARRQLYEINRIASTDDPAATDDGFAPFEDYARTILDASWFQPEGQFMAFDGEKAVGLSAVSYFAEANAMFNMLTGVARAYRGWKIARALKPLTIRCAEDH